MTTPLTRKYNLGYVDSRPRKQLVNGEMQTATGIHYKPGDPDSFYKIGGRSTFGDTGTAAKIDGLALCLFDSGGTDKLVGLSGNVLYGATPGATGTFATLYTPTTSPTTLDSAHAQDNWYLALGTENRVLKSDGTTRAMGMKAPSEQLSYTTNDQPSIEERPTADDSGWSDPEKAYDAGTGYINTAAYTALSAAGSDVCVWDTFASDTGAGRKLYVLWSVWQGNVLSTNLGAVVRLKVEIAEDGSTYAEVGNFLMSKTHVDEWVSIDVTDTTVNLNTVKVRATATYVTGTKEVTFQIHDIVVKAAGGGSAGAKSVTKMLVSYTEWDETHGHESVMADPIEVTFTDKDSATYTLPAAAVNSTATHWRIYRAPDNGTTLQMGKIAEIPVAETTFDDFFDPWGVADQPPNIIPLLTITADEGTQSFQRDGEPPNLSRIAYFKGGLAGLSPVDTRVLHYAVPGFPESWPTIYRIDKFPFPDNDELLDLAEVGDTLILAAKSVMIRTTELPRSVAGTFIADEITAIAGAPGCVGPNAMTVVNYRGVSHAAWISPENGVLVTDGDKWDSISDDLDWSQFDGFDKSGWALHYLKHLRVLVLSYSATSGGTNDRYWLLHLDKDHVKPNGQAKITGPHYGAAVQIVAGKISSTTRVYEAHPTDGKVYLNLNSATGADSSNAYNTSGESPMIVKGPRRYDGGIRGYAAIDAFLDHGDFGTGQTVTLAYAVGRDASGSSETRSQTVSLAGEQTTQVDISRSGLWHEETLTHLGTGISHVAGMTMRSDVQGDEGAQKVVA